MCQKIKAFVLCVTLPFVFMSAISDLIKQSKELSEKTKLLYQENREHTLLLENLDKQIDKLFNKLVSDGTGLTLNAETEKLAALESNLTANYAYLASILKLINDEKLICTIVNFKNRLIKEDIEFFQKRRTRGDDEKCEVLLSSFEVSSRSLSGRKKAKVAEERVLKKYINTQYKTLTFVEKIKKGFIEEIAEKKKLMEKIQSDILHKIGEDFSDVLNVRKAVAKEQEKISEIRLEIHIKKMKLQNLVKTNRKLKEELNTLRDTLKGYQQDKLCYKQFSYKVAGHILNKNKLSTSDIVRHYEESSKIDSKKEISIEEIIDNNLPTKDVSIEEGHNENAASHDDEEVPNKNILSNRFEVQEISNPNVPNNVALTKVFHHKNEAEIPKEYESRTVVPHARESLSKNLLDSFFLLKQYLI